ncbi:uncharacterized protein LOC126782157 [Argentina anserina]|uniref:uncharacterized protein LOC126782157 n=1 Tax=Argentina anserina TaxID=57926 RepID=UPI00217656C8|nr:uncharacterized protein LOC126782157 [Potentilla anserina]
MTDSEDDGIEEEVFIQTLGVTACLIHSYYMRYVHKNPSMTSSQTGNKWLMEIIHGNDNRFYSALRMEKPVFYNLLHDLEVNFGVLGSNQISHLEVVALVVYVFGQGCGLRTAVERFQHSLETIWRYYNIAIDVLNELAKLIIKPVDPQFNGVAPEILRDKRYMPHFKDCIGAIDGVHVPAFVPPEYQVPYIGRKGAPTQNIMAACDFHMQFIFVCAGWEGSAHDTRVFLSVLRNPEMNFPMPPPGKYYVVDSGYPQMSGFLTPDKGHKQHFQQYRGRGQEPRNEKEVFNQVHSSLRGVIERTFGVWKKKWKVLKDMQGYAIERQVKIVIATMALHNYIRRHASRDKDFTQFGEGSRNMSNSMMDMDNDAQEEYHGHGAQEMDAIRNGIAQSLMRVRNDRNV